MPVKSIEVYDPPMCCSTGVCGTEVDPALIQFASDVGWLREQGVRVERYNLAQQPAAFATNAGVASALKDHGNACLPLVLVDGVIATRSIYPSRAQLAQLAGLEKSPCCGGGDGQQSGCCG
jgi:hypothetical protein